MGFSPDDRRHMTRALQLARRGLYTTDPNPRVGAVLVRDGDVVGEGFHERAGEAHAERQALAAAGDRARGADCYVTLEPCSHTGRTGPCAEALVAAGVARVILAMEDPNPRVAGSGVARLRQAGIRVDTGLLESEARALNPGFIRRMEAGLPWVRLKLAASLDGRTGMASGESQWITGPQAREAVQRLRARSSAVVTGSGTVLADRPSLTVRPAEWQHSEYLQIPVRQPLRVVLDSRLRSPLDAPVFAAAEQCLVFSAPGAEQDRRQVFRDAGVEVVEAGAVGNGVNLRTVLEELARRGANEVLFECGAELAGELVREDLMDELVLFMAPTLLGSSARPLLALPEIEEMSARRRLVLTDLRQLGDDLQLVLRPAGRGA